MGVLFLVNCRVNALAHLWRCDRYDPALHRAVRLRLLWRDYLSCARVQIGLPRFRCDELRLQSRTLRPIGTYDVIEPNDDGNDLERVGWRLGNSGRILLQRNDLDSRAVIRAGLSRLG